MHAPHGGPLPVSMSGGYRCYNPSVFALLLVPPDRQVTGRYARIRVFRSLPTTSEPWQSFDSKLADVGNVLVWQLGRYLRWPRVGPIAWRKSQGQQGPAGQSRPLPAMAKSTKWIAFGADQPSALRLPWQVLPWFFLICKANARVYDAKSGHGLHSPPPGVAASPKRLTSHTSSLQLSQSGLRTQTANQPKFIPPILVQGNLGPSLWHDQSRPSAWLQNR